MSHSRVWSVFIVLVTMAPAAGVDASQRQLFDLDVYRTVFGSSPTSADVSAECAKDLQTYLVSLEQNKPWTILSTYQYLSLKIAIFYTLELHVTFWSSVGLVKACPSLNQSEGFGRLQIFCSISSILRSGSILCGREYVTE